LLTKDQPDKWPPDQFGPELVEAVQHLGQLQQQTVCAADQNSRKWRAPGSVGILRFIALLCARVARARQRLISVQIIIIQIDKRLLLLISVGIRPIVNFSDVHD
jgi:hypothetical protein